MNIYIAAKFERRFEMREVHYRLSRLGHSPVSSWIFLDAPASDQTHGANADVADLNRAETVLFFAQPIGSQNKGGGRYWEMGYAYAMKKRIICVGQREIIFMSLPPIEVYETLDEAVGML